MNPKPELLVPAGSLEKLRYGIAYGADAVYAGAPQLSLRARENSFSYEQIVEGVKHCHDRGKKFYLTLNILAHNRKIPSFANKIDDMVAAKPDALIMADPGLIDMVKEKHPEQEIHLSVQANAMNWATVKFWKKMGVSRIILSRELSIDEVKEIKDKVPEMELEVFVHGAICIAHSGRCLLSNFFNYRDANDGCCTNACRWSYKTYTDKPTPNPEPFKQDYENIQGNYYIEETTRPGQLMAIDEDEFGTYIMNAKDLMAIEYLEDLMKAGVDSFKIEGRTKSIYYLALTTRTYRTAIDELSQGKSFDSRHLKELMKIPNRGYTAGMLIDRADHDIQNYEQGVSSVHDQEFAGIIKEIRPQQILIDPKNKLQLGDQLEVITPENSFTCKIESMTTKENQSVDVVHGGSQKEVWIPVPYDLNPNQEGFGLASKVVG